MQMNFYSFEYSFQKESGVLQSEWLVIFHARLLRCWSWRQQIPLQKGIVKLWDIDVSSWSQVSLMNSEKDVECIQTQLAKVALMTKKEWLLKNAGSFVSNAQHIKPFGSICPEKQSEWSRDP